MQKVFKNSRQSFKKSDNFWGKYTSRTMSTIYTTQAGKKTFDNVSLTEQFLLVQIIQGWTTVLQSKLSNASFLCTFYINKVVFENYWLLKVKVGIHRAGKGFGSKFFRLAPCHVSLSAMYSPTPQMFGHGCAYLLACLLLVGRSGKGAR